MKDQTILDTIGNTHHVRINRLFRDDIQVWMKLERSNPGGSIKDRIALAMIEDAEAKGILNKRSVIIEPTSGNTGIGLAMVAAAKGYKLVLVMPESMSVERRKLMSLYGAEFVLTPKEKGMKGAVEKATEMTRETPDAWMPRKILTQLSEFWFSKIGDIVPNHLITTDVDRFPAACRPHRSALEGRSMLVKKSSPAPVECIVRGYITGSAWKDYQKTGAVCGIALPQGLVEAARLLEPIFTPSTKAAVGAHDINISFDAMVDKVGKVRAEKMREATVAIYQRARTIAETKGIIIADTKFEFGMEGDDILLIDEVLTPDSSRFWPMDGYRPGRTPDSFDKQFVRDYLLSLKWDMKPPAPELPAGRARG